jgi:hypothetical protein
MIHDLLNISRCGDRKTLIEVGTRGREKKKYNQKEKETCTGQRRRRKETR